MTAIGHLIGYIVGSIDMVSLFGTTLGDTQFKQMTVIAAASLIFAVLVTSYSVKERVLISARSVYHTPMSSFCVPVDTQALQGLRREDWCHPGAVPVIQDDP